MEILYEIIMTIVKGISILVLSFSLIIMILYKGVLSSILFGFLLYIFLLPKRAKNYLKSLSGAKEMTIYIVTFLLIGGLFIGGLTNDYDYDQLVELVKSISSY